MLNTGPLTNIYAIVAREILDSRGNPTIETMTVLESGYRGVASIPAGASKGKYEAVELRDNDPKRYGGQGVLKAVSNVNTIIAHRMKGTDARDQKNIDTMLTGLDGTIDKHMLGANALLSVSLSVAAASAAAMRVPQYVYLNALFNQYIPAKILRIPTPIFNVINGGKHGAGNLDFQEFQIIPASNKLFHDALRMGVEVYQSLKQILIYRNAVHSVGDEGGFAPDLFTNIEALAVMQEAIRATPYRFGVDIFFGLDLAASHFRKEYGYQIKDRPTIYTGKDFISYLSDLHTKYRLLVLEDALGEDDWEHWKLLTSTLGRDVFIVGDDLLVTNLTRLKRAVEEKACSAILIKPNQIGTLSEFFEVAAYAKKNDFKTIVSHRSGETNDAIIADLAVGIQSDYTKFGAPVRGERVAKYNRLLQIETELQAKV
jgi:enolase